MSQPPISCADPGIFIRGVQVSLTKKALTFFWVFFSPQLINGQFRRNLSRFQRGSNIFQRGGVQLFPGGSNCLFPIETHITCDFPGGVRTPCPPPSGSALAYHSCNGMYYTKSFLQMDWSYNNATTRLAKKVVHEIEFIDIVVIQI